jgi:hypothetical protein
MPETRVAEYVERVRQLALVPTDCTTQLRGALAAVALAQRRRATKTERSAARRADAVMEPPRSDSAVREFTGGPVADLRRPRSGPVAPRRLPDAPAGGGASLAHALAQANAVVPQ